MKEKQLIEQSTDTLSDEEFLKNSESHIKSVGRSNRYKKKNTGKSSKIGFWIFLAATFLISFYLFSNYLFNSHP